MTIDKKNRTSVETHFPNASIFDRAFSIQADVKSLFLHINALICFYILFALNSLALRLITIELLNVRFMAGHYRSLLVPHFL